MPMMMTTLGHTIHCNSMLNQNFHLAWGSLPDTYVDPWTLTTPVADIPPSTSVLISDDLVRGSFGSSGESSEVIGYNSDGTYKTVEKIVRVEWKADQSTTYVYTKGADYEFQYVNGTPRIHWLTVTSGAIPRPPSGSQYKVYYRYTTTDINNLILELGRISPIIQEYVFRDDVNGAIQANNVNWSISKSTAGAKIPTRNLYLMFKFSSDQAIGRQIYQLGLYINSGKLGDQTSTGYIDRSGTDQLDPQRPGSLYMMENIIPFSRISGKREIFEYVITY